MEQEAYKQKLNRDFLIGVIISMFFFGIIQMFLAFYLFYYFHGGFVLIGLASGIIGGICNEDIIRSVLGGVVGVSFGLFGFPLHFGIYLFGGYITPGTIGVPQWGWFPIGYFVILSVLFGGLGGLIGHQIRVKLIKKTKPTDINNAEI